MKKENIQMVPSSRKGSTASRLTEVQTLSSLRKTSCDSGQNDGRFSETLLAPHGIEYGIEHMARRAYGTAVPYVAPFAHTSTFRTTHYLRPIIHILHLPSRFVVQDLYNTDPTQETSTKSCRSCGSHPAT